MGELGPLIEELLKYGPLGLAILSFISNLFPGFPAIYLSLIASYAAVSPSSLHSLSAVLLAGTGAGLGKVTLFLSSSALGSRLGYVRKRRKLLKKLLQGGRSLQILVFLFAALPLPDDLLYIPLAVAGFSPLQFAISVVLGKIALATFAYSLGLVAKNFVSAYLDSVGRATLMDVAVAGAIVISLSLLITYVVITIDWLKVIAGYASGGVRGAVRELLRELRSLVPKQK
ncbi:MAG: hypothetical protein NZ902_05025 [Acidilobaceae archaeon]|nr:hypothetical protein [Acidilobaceae archaeon]MCX8165931.1 hypothetical protein [Acidilobaceae archaeon]MDW7974574.1 hypothetical protein [Sulfolobales archaeon]